MMKNTLLILSIIVSGVLFGQNVEFDKKNFDDKDGFKEAKSNLKEGDERFEQGGMFYKEALPFYEKAQEFNPSNADLNYKLGKCYLLSVDKLKALDRLKKALQLNPSIDPEINYHLGVANHLWMNWDAAIAAYSKYQSIAMQDPNPAAYQEIKNRIQQCYNGRELVKNPIRVFIDNLGENINTQFNEYGAVISADESVIVYTARQPNSTGGKKDPMLNEHFEDIYIAYRGEDGTWSQGVNLTKPVNTDDHDAISGISADGQKFLIYLGKYGNGDLFESVLTGEEWSKPESVSKNINTKSHEPSACYSPDGNSIYYVSDKPGGLGGHDIYLSVKDEKGRWQEGVNLGNSINTQFDEDGVFMHPDGKTLYFSSQGHSSMGGFDIFKTVYDEATKTWTEPKNIGYPVNTPDDDVFFVLSASGKRGYYTSLNPEGMGGRDLYVITFLGAEKPMVLNTEDNLIASNIAPVEEIVVAPKVEVKEAQLTLLKGVISDALTEELLEADIEIVDNQANKVIATFKSNASTGKYLVSLPAGKNYGIAVKKDGYLFHSENFDIPNESAFQVVEKDVQLKQLAVGGKIVLKNIFFDLDKATLRPESTAELNRLIKLMNDVPTLKIELGGHTDSRGSDSHNQDLSERRAKAVVDYLTEAGISGNRLESAGYGETQLVNGCSNGVDCTKEQHQENRRTEFKVLEL